RFRHVPGICRAPVRDMDRRHRSSQCHAESSVRGMGAWEMKTRLSRRRLAQTLLASAAIEAAAQTSPPPTPDADLKAARDRLKANGDRLGAQNVPMDVEPAFQFKA